MKELKHSWVHLAQMRSFYLVVIDVGIALNAGNRHLVEEQFKVSARKTKAR